MKAVVQEEAGAAIAGPQAFLPMEKYYTVVIALKQDGHQCLSVWIVQYEEKEIRNKESLE